MWQYGKKSVSSRIFDIANGTFLVLLSIITIYPFIYVLFASFSDPDRLMAHRGLLFAPLGFTINGYTLAFKTDDIINGYKVTGFVVVVGTVLNLLMTTMFAYVLSRRGMLWNRFLTIMVVITMYFSGGMIPTFLIVKAVGLYNSIWSLIFPGLISTYLLIIMRTAIMGVPAELEESARLDGAGEFRVLYQIVLPMIIPTIAALGLFYAVQHWNAWTNALIYLKDKEKFPLQLVLRTILINNQAGAQMSGGAYEGSQNEAYKRLMKYSTVMISVIPIMLIYPFIQKHFTQGVMIGALKG